MSPAAVATAAPAAADGVDEPGRTIALRPSDLGHHISHHPGNVKINIQGAFIVDDEPESPASEDYQHDCRDIRLPNHNAIVSHIAVDVSVSLPALLS